MKKMTTKVVLMETNICFVESNAWNILIWKWLIVCQVECWILLTRSLVELYMCGISMFLLWLESLHIYAVHQYIYLYVRSW